MFTACGLAPDAAQRVAAGLVEADLEGVPSHGVMLVDMYIERIRRGSVSTRGEADVVSDRGCAVVLDAGHALGHLTGEQAMELAIERAQTSRCRRRRRAAWLSFRHRPPLRATAAQAGCIGIAMCNTRPLMPAPGGAERVVGNNPIAIALPVDGAVPIVLDMATSEAAMGKIRMAEKASEPIPANWAAKADGTPTTDAPPKRWPACCCRRADRRASASHSSSISCAGCSRAAPAATRCGRSTAIFRCRMIARISSSPSTSRISAISTAFAGRPRPPPIGSGPGGARRGSSGCLPRASRNGASASVPAARRACPGGRRHAGTVRARASRFGCTVGFAFRSTGHRTCPSVTRRRTGDW